MTPFPPLVGEAGRKDVGSTALRAFLKQVVSRRLPELHLSSLTPPPSTRALAPGVPSWFSTPLRSVRNDSELLWLSMKRCELIGTNRNCKESVGISKNSYELLRIMKNLYELLGMCRNYEELFRITRNYCELLRNWKELLSKCLGSSRN